MKLSLFKIKYYCRIIFIIVMLIACNVYADVKSAQPVYRLEIGNSPVIGPANAAVTIIGFSDFECPFCSEISSAIKLIMKEFKGDIRYSFKHFPLPTHDGAVLAAKTAVAAGQQGKFWEVHDRIFNRKEDISYEYLKSIVSNAGLDLSQFEKDFESEKTMKQISYDKKQAFQFGVNGTPTLFINGIMFNGKLSELRDKITEQVSVGKKIKNSGISDIYSELIKNGKERALEVGSNNKKIVPTKIHAIDIPGDTPMSGLMDAPVTVIIFEDLQNPACLEFYRIFSPIKDKFKDTIRVFTIQSPSKRWRKSGFVSKALIAAEKHGKFDELHTKFMKDHSIWTKSEVTPFLKEYVYENQLDISGVKRYGKRVNANAVISYLIRSAKRLNIDAEVFKNSLSSLIRRSFDSYLWTASLEIGFDFESLKKEMDNSATGGIFSSFNATSKIANIKVTPTVFINGRKMEGLYNAEKYSETIRDENNNVKELIEKGLNGNQIYQHVIGHSVLESGGKDDIEQCSG